MGDIVNYYAVAILATAVAFAVFCYGVALLDGTK